MDTTENSMTESNENTESDAENHPTDADPLEAVWNRIVLEWGEEKLHDAFIHIAADRGELARAASHYRDHLANAEHAELARKKTEAIVTLALALPDNQRTPPATTPRIVVAVAAALCLCALGLLALSLIASCATLQ